MELLERRSLTTNEELYKELHSMKEAQDRHKETIDRWRVRVETQQNRHILTLYGNGEPGLDERIRDHERRLKEVAEIAKVIQPMILFYKVGVWLAMLMGASVVALVWALITGQAELHFR